VAGADRIDADLRRCSPCTQSTARTQRFPSDGRLPRQRISERALRRQAVGRKNSLFVGSDDGACPNAVFTSLLASCRMHDIEPWAYLRDLLCLLPRYPKHRALELAPAYWNLTQQRDASSTCFAVRVPKNCADDPAIMDQTGHESLTTVHGTIGERRSGRSPRVRSSAFWFCSYRRMARNRPTTSRSTVRAPRSPPSAATECSSFGC
jgi:hypothetical protein